MRQVINSKDNVRVKHAYSLFMKKKREEYKEFLIEGKKNLSMALKANAVKEIFTTIPLDNVPKQIPVYEINDPILEKLTTSNNPEGVVAVCRFIESDNSSDYHKVVYLDHINDPGNMGTIIRTALALGYDAIGLSENCCDLYNEKVIAASKGSLFFIPVLNGNIKYLFPNHQIIVSTLGDKSLDVEEAKNRKEKNYVVVLGNESHGVKEDIISCADLLVKIPMNKMDSLNVSVAAGILLYLFK